VHSIELEMGQKISFESMYEMILHDIFYFNPTNFDGTKLKYVAMEAVNE